MWCNYACFFETNLAHQQKISENEYKTSGFDSAGEIPVQNKNYVVIRPKNAIEKHSRL